VHNLKQSEKGLDIALGAYEGGKKIDSSLNMLQWIFWVVLLDADQLNDQILPVVIFTDRYTY
jgi:hypothetical protein